MPSQSNKISGKKIYCEGHRIEKVRPVKQSDGHGGFFTYVKSDWCEVVIDYEWKKGKK